MKASKAAGLGAVVLLLALLSVLQLRAWGTPIALAVVLGTVQTGPLVTVNRAPVPSWAVVTAGLTASTFLGYGQGSLGWPWPAASCLAALIVLVVVAVLGSRRTAVVAGVATAAALLPAAFTVPLPPGLVILAVGVVAGAVALGDNVRTRREAQGRLRAEAARRGALHERAYITRDMHDIVAHRLSLIVLQAEAAPRQVAGLPEAAAAKFEVLRSVAADGLAEMRRMVDLLRDDATDSSQQPAPRLGDLSALIRGARRSGMVVHARVALATTAPSRMIEAVAYRTIQEALSNAARHATGAEVDVEVVSNNGWLQVRVQNGPPHAAPKAPAQQKAGSGYGLRGMRERVAAAGGNLNAEALADGGFAVTARLPVPQDGGAG